MLNFIKNNWKKVVIIGALVILIIIIASGKNKNDTGFTKYTVTSGEVSDKLLLSGEVEPVSGAEMAFPTSGLVDTVYKNAGDPVISGEKIIELDNNTLRADLLSAEANLELEIAQGKVTDAEEDVAVQNAYSKLLSDGLAAYTKDRGQTDPAPDVSGSYTGKVEGEYKIQIRFSNSASGYSMHYSGIEDGDTEISFYKATPLGTKGLYLKFERGETDVGDSWVISVPNVQGENYLENLNTYKSALASSQASSNSAVSKEVTNAKIKQAQAEVASIVAQINERTIRAPFSGVVSKMDIKKGEIAESGKVITGVVSSDAYEVVVEVPEVDVVNLQAGLPAEITLDAYGDDVIFPGTILSVDPAETKVDGVSVYRAKASFTQTDTRIRSGMTANVLILKEKKDSVLKIPTRFIEKDETGQFVMVENGENMDKVYITTGLHGSDGSVEVLTGLKSGDVIMAKFEPVK